MTAEDQLSAWLAGSPTCPNDRGECCPDFSCCRRHLLWPLEKRAQFVSGSRGEREAMLPDAIAALLVDSGTDVRVIGASK